MKKNNKTTNELAIFEIQPEKALSIFTNPEDELNPILKAIEKEARALVADATTKKGRDAIRSNAMKVAKAKALIERAGKDLADKQKRIPKLIDASRKQSREFLELLHAEVRAPLTEWEEAETKRVNELEARLNAIKQLALFEFDPTAAQIFAVLEKAKSTEINESWQEYAEQASAEKHRVITELTELYAKAEKAEAEAAELERLRKEVAEREAKEAAERQAREEIERKLENLLSIPSNSEYLSIPGLKGTIESIKAQPVIAEEWGHRYAEAVDAKTKVILTLKNMFIDAEQAEERRIKQAAEAIEIEAERKAKEAEEKAKADLEAAKRIAEHAKIAAVAKAKADAEEKEAARLAEVEREKEAERKRAANRKHRADVNSVASSYLMTKAGVTKQQADIIVASIAKNEIPNVFIKY